MTKMKTLTMGGTTYEVVDDTARTGPVAAERISAGTFGETGVRAAIGTDYEIPRVRNIFANTIVPTLASSNGNIRLTYE